jgi:hypothetical protein
LLRQYMMSMINRRPSELSQLLPAASPLAIDLIGRYVTELHVLYLICCSYCTLSGRPSRSLVRMCVIVP